VQSLHCDVLKSVWIRSRTHSFDNCQSACKFSFDIVTATWNHKHSVAYHCPITKTNFSQDCSNSTKLIFAPLNNAGLGKIIVHKSVLFICLSYMILMTTELLTIRDAKFVYNNVLHNTITPTLNSYWLHSLQQQLMFTYYHSHISLRFRSTSLKERNFMCIGKMQHSHVVGIPVNYLLMADEASTSKCVPI